jgi:hypothetical protein
LQGLFHSATLRPVRNDSNWMSALSRFPAVCQIREIPWKVPSPKYLRSG